MQCGCAKTVSRSWIRHNKDSWIRVKARPESAGGLKVRALAQTARGAGLNPVWHSILSCLIKIALRETIIYKKFFTMSIVLYKVFQVSRSVQ